jgi:hypothetical protein
MGIVKNSITFGSGFNITAEGPIDSRMVVETIGDLTTVWGTDFPVFEGMVVSVLEDNNVYVLKAKPFSNLENWKKIGSDVDIDVEEIKTSSKKLSAPIIVAGLSESIGNVENGMEFDTEDSIEDILRELLCKEVYPTVSLTTVNPTLSFGGITSWGSSNHSTIMKIGSELNLKPVTIGSASISDGYRVGSGFTWGYSSIDDSDVDNGENNPLSISAETSLNGNYTLTETYSPTTIGSPRTVEPSNNYEAVKFEEGSVKIALGTNTITFSASSPSGSYKHPEYPEYYVVSNLGKTDVNNKLSKSGEINATLNSITDNNKSITVIGVYPVYTNIKSNSLVNVNDMEEMNLTDSDTIELIVPSEVASQKHFTFDYPSTHEVTSFEIEDLKGNFVDFASAYNKESETITKTINGEVVSYKRFITTGKLQGESTYKIKLSKPLSGGESK